MEKKRSGTLKLIFIDELRINDLRRITRIISNTKNMILVLCIRMSSNSLKYENSQDLSVITLDYTFRQSPRLASCLDTIFTEWLGESIIKVPPPDNSSPGQPLTWVQLKGGEWGDFTSFLKAFRQQNTEPFILMGGHDFTAWCRDNGEEIVTRFQVYIQKN